MAVGFEPTVKLPPHTLSRRAPLAARTRHRREEYKQRAGCTEPVCPALVSVRRMGSLKLDPSPCTGGGHICERAREHEIGGDVVSIGRFGPRWGQKGGRRSWPVAAGPTGCSVQYGLLGAHSWPETWRTILRLTCGRPSTRASPDSTTGAVSGPQFPMGPRPGCESGTYA